MDHPCNGVFLNAESNSVRTNGSNKISKSDLICHEGMVNDKIEQENESFTILYISELKCDKVMNFAEVVVVNFALHLFATTVILSCNYLRFHHSFSVDVFQ